MHGAGEVLGVETLPLNALGELLPLLGHHLHQGQTIAAFEGRAQRIGQPFLDPLTGHKTIDHHFDVVAVVLVELDVVGQLAHLTVDAHPGETFRRQTTDQLGVGALLAAHHRRQQLIAGSLRQQQDLIDHFVDALRLDRTATLGAVGLAGTAEQQTEIVLNLRDRAHRGTGVVTGGFLINRNRRRQALDGIDIGLVHLPQKLAGIGRKTFDVAALSLGKDRVEGK